MELKRMMKGRATNRGQDDEERDGEISNRVTISFTWLIKDYWFREQPEEGNKSRWIVKIIRRGDRGQSFMNHQVKWTKLYVHKEQRGEDRQGMGYSKWRLIKGKGRKLGYYIRRMGLFELSNDLDMKHQVSTVDIFHHIIQTVLEKGWTTSLYQSFMPPANELTCSEIWP